MPFAAAAARVMLPLIPDERWSHDRCRYRPRRARGRWIVVGAPAPLRRGHAPRGRGRPHAGLRRRRRARRQARAPGGDRLSRSGSQGAAQDRCDVLDRLHDQAHDLGGHHDAGGGGTGAARRSGVEVPAAAGRAEGGRAGRQHARAQADRRPSRTCCATPRVSPTAIAAPRRRMRSIPAPRCGRRSGCPRTRRSPRWPSRRCCSIPAPTGSTASPPTCWASSSRP